MIKKGKPVFRMITIFLFLVILAVLAACSVAPGSTTTTGTTAGAETTTSSERTFTLGELAQYDGQNDNPAYIAVEGIVYDVTNVSVWDHKSHAGRFIAGKDYTEELKKAPHSASMLSQATKVGILVQ